MQMSNIKPDADDVMEVCVNFKVQETPESISRIIDDFVKISNILKFKCMAEEIKNQGQQENAEKLE